jgi:hypothetical protein
MTDDFTSETLAYLLDELDAGRRAQFEQRLARDAAAEAAFKACADSFAEFVLTQAPGLPVAEDVRERMLAAVIRAAGGGDGHRHPRWKRYFWPMAAAALLALNAGQWIAGHRGPGAIRTGSVARDETEKSAHTSDAVRIASRGADGSRGVSQILPHDANPEVMEILDRVAVLRRENDHLQASNSVLNAETQRLSQQVAELTAANGGTTRLVAIELVDATAYANGNRNGLLDLARTILTTPGVVAASPAPATSSTGPNPAPTLTLNQATGAQTSIMVSSVVNLQAISAGSLTLVEPFTGAQGSVTAFDAGSTSLVSGLTVTGAAATTTTATNTLSAGTSTAGPPPASEPYAWSVFDESQREGFLNLYNLPAVPSGESLQLWVQPVGSSTFENVGAIPSQYYGGSGSVYYKLPSQTGTPSQILITVEPSQAVPATPAGTVVLRGP